MSVGSQHKRDPGMNGRRTATSDTKSAGLFIGGKRSESLVAQVAVHTHPQTEYLYLAENFAVELAGFNDIETIAAQERGVAANLLHWKTLREKLSPYWGYALLSLVKSRHWQSLLVTGEDIGLPVALAHSARRQSLPLGILTHGSYLNSSKFRIVAKLLRRRTDIRWLCLSESLSKRMIEQFQFAPDSVVNVGYGVDTTFFSPSARIHNEANQTIIASAGMARRDYRTLVAATSSLTENVQVKIAADSAWFCSHLDIQGMALPPHIEVRSFGNYEGLRSLYEQSSFVVVPLYESVHACGYAVIVEAMAMGKTVITTNIKGRSDYIIEGETGFYVPPGDVEALRERIVYLIKHPEVAQQMGINARKHIEQHFSLEHYSHRIASALGWALPQYDKI